MVLIPMILSLRALALEPADFQRATRFRLTTPEVRLDSGVIRPMPPPMPRKSWVHAAFEMWVGEHATLSATLDGITMPPLCSSATDGTGTAGPETRIRGVCTPAVDVGLGGELTLGELPLSLWLMGTASRVSDLMGLGVLFGIRGEF